MGFKGENNFHNKILALMFLISVIVCGSEAPLEYLAEGELGIQESGYSIDLKIIALESLKYFGSKFHSEKIQSKFSIQTLQDIAKAVSQSIADANEQAYQLAKIRF